jgi:hypothetical protein
MASSLGPMAAFAAGCADMDASLLLPQGGSISPVTLAGLLLLQPALTALTARAQTTANLWVRNGGAWANQMLNYSGMPQALHLQDCDLRTLQAAGLLLTPQHLFAALADRFDVGHWLTAGHRPTVTAHLPPGYDERLSVDQRIALLAELCTLLIQASTNLPVSAEGPIAPPSAPFEHVEGPAAAAYRARGLRMTARDEAAVISTAAAAAAAGGARGRETRDGGGAATRATGRPAGPLRRLASDEGESPGFACGGRGRGGGG